MPVISGTLQTKKEIILEEALIACNIVLTREAQYSINDTLVRYLSKNHHEELLDTDISFGKQLNGAAEKVLMKFHYSNKKFKGLNGTFTILPQYAQHSATYFVAKETN